MTDFTLPKEITDLKHPIMEVNLDNVAIVVRVWGRFQNLSKTVMWLFAKNPHFGESAPLRLMQIGRANKVLEFILHETSFDGPETIWAAFIDGAMLTWARSEEGLNLSAVEKKNPNITVKKFREILE
jgi:hypothetical protein